VASLPCFLVAENIGVITSDNPSLMRREHQSPTAAKVASATVAAEAAAERHRSAAELAAQAEFTAIVSGHPEAVEAAAQAAEGAKSAKAVVDAAKAAVETSHFFNVGDVLAEIVVCLIGFVITVSGQQALARRSKKPKKRTAGNISVPTAGRSQLPAPTVVALSPEKSHNSAPAQASPASAASYGGNKRPLEAVSALNVAGDVKSLVTAVSRGRAMELPTLVEGILSRFDKRSSDWAGRERLISELLTNALRACAAYSSFKEGLAAYESVASSIGKGDKGLWSVLLYAATEANAFSRSRFFYARLSSVGEPSGHDLVNIIRCLAKEHDLQGLEQVLDNLPRLHGTDNRIKPGAGFDAVTRNRALSACYKERALDLAAAIARSNKFGSPLDTVAYNTLMTCFAREGKLERVFEIHEEMKRVGAKRTQVTFGVLIDACIGVGDVDRAKLVCQELKTCGLSMNAVHCTSLIKGLIGAQRLNEAGRLLEEMQNSECARPDIITYSTLVRAHAEHGNVKAALLIFEGMKKQGVQPDELICNAIFSGCHVNVMRACEVLECFERVMEMAGLKPSTITLSILLKALAKTSAWHASLKLLEVMPERYGVQPEIRLYFQLAQDCIKADDKTMALEIHDAMVKQMRSCGQEVDESIRRRLLRQCNVVSGSTAGFSRQCSRKS